MVDPQSKKSKGGSEGPGSAQPKGYSSLSGGASEWDAGTDSARTAYDLLAPGYDAFTAQNNYELWLGQLLLPEMEKYGLRRGWALDLACGTGRAFPPLLDRGWRVVGCDYSPGMLREARSKFGSRVQLFEADARKLPVFCPGPGHRNAEAFTLVTMIDDAADYLTGDDDLGRTFEGVARNLDHDRGLFLFDTNTLSQYRKGYASGAVDRGVAQGWKWRGLTDSAESGIVYEGLLSGPNVPTHLHRQRHRSVERVTETLQACGLRCLATLGQREEGTEIILNDRPDEERDDKVIYIARANEF